MATVEMEREERKEKSYANTTYEFNKFKSDAIGTLRDLPDTRHQKYNSIIYTSSTFLFRSCNKGWENI